MPKLTADEMHVWSVQDFIDAHPQLSHLRPRKRGDTITLESGPTDDALAHARIRRVTSQWWMLEMPDQHRRWSVVPALRAPIRQLLDVLIEQFPWALAPRA